MTPITVRSQPGSPAPAASASPHEAPAPAASSAPGRVWPRGLAWPVALRFPEPTRRLRRLAELRRSVLAEQTLLLLGPLALLAAATLALRLSDWDIAICGWFFDARQGGWLYHRAEPWNALYHYGVYPALALGVCGAALALVGCFWRPLRAHRKAGLFLALLLVVGPGLAINGVFKPFWNRPRPVQVRQFGGAHEFVPVWDWSLAEGGRSFPSGHASMGFYLMAPAFALYRRHPRWALAFLLLGLAGGGVMGLTRVVQGGHFPSDVIWSGGMVYLSGVALSFALGLHGWKPTPASPRTDPALNVAEEEGPPAVLRMADAREARQARAKKRRGAPPKRNAA